MFLKCLKSHKNFAGGQLLPLKSFDTIKMLIYQQTLKVIAPQHESFIV